MSNQKYWTFPISSLEELLKTDEENGLKEYDLEWRREKWGVNKLPKMKRPSGISIFLRQFKDVMILILLAASIAGLLIKEWIEATVILLVVLINVLLGFIQELKAEKALEALQNLTVPSALVIRDGERKTVSSETLVVGDLVWIEEGNLIPADIRLCEATNLQVTESILTGESAPVDKTIETITKETTSLSQRKNCAFMSTLVSKGHGKGIVVTTGLNTEVGKISHQLDEKTTEETLLQKRLKKLGKILVILSILLCSLVSIIGIIRIRLKKNDITLEEIKRMVKIGISLAVSVIPEGLVAVVTFTMALGVQRMAKNGVIVRRITAIETLGSITTICTDKTGTLTEGTMKVSEIAFQNEFVQVTGEVHKRGGDFILEESEDKFNLERNSVGWGLIMMICALCNSSKVTWDNEKKIFKTFGDPTEIALEEAAEKCFLGKQKWLSLGYHFVSEVSFDSVRKRMTVVYRREKEKTKALCKGSLDSILSISNRIMQKNGSIGPLDPQRVKEIENQEIAMAKKGLRVLGFAYKEFEFKEMDLNESEIEKNLIFLGLVGLLDPPRENMKCVVQNLGIAGVDFCIITGDDPVTAFAVARRLGIVKNDDFSQVHEGEVHEDLVSAKNFPKIFARTTPGDKVTIVKALKKRGEICAMIGDGVNDAPAIQKAQVGIAMGKTGTDLAKQAAHVILCEDNAEKVIDALLHGRQIYDNIYKFIIYLLSCNSSEIYVMLTAVIAGLPVPFSAVMILWANLIVDVPPALALGVEPTPIPKEGHQPEILKRKPRDPQTGIFTKSSTFIILFHGVLMASLTLGLYCFVLYHLDYSSKMDFSSAGHAGALAFINLATLHLFHSFLSRSTSASVFSINIFSNLWLLFGVAISLTLLISCCYIPKINKWLDQYPLELKDWIMIGVCLLIHIIVIEITKLIFRMKRPKKSKFYHDIV